MACKDINISSNSQLLYVKNTDFFEQNLYIIYFKPVVTFEAALIQLQCIKAETWVRSGKRFKKNLGVIFCIYWNQS